MSYTLQVSALAEADFADAVNRYGHIRPGLAADFILCLDEAIDRIIRNPFLYQILFLDVRRALVRRFPYGIIYRVTGSQVKIEAFFPDNMDPATMRHRLA